MNNPFDSFEGFTPVWTLADEPKKIGNDSFDYKVITEDATSTVSVNFDYAKKDTAAPRSRKTKYGYRKQKTMPRRLPSYLHEEMIPDDDSIAYSTIQSDEHKE
jgi:hypothetical protein